MPSIIFTALPLNNFMFFTMPLVLGKLSNLLLFVLIGLFKNLSIIGVYSIL